MASAQLEKYIAIRIRSTGIINSVVAKKQFTMIRILIAALLCGSTVDAWISSGTLTTFESYL